MAELDVGLKVVDNTGTTRAVAVQAVSDYDYGSVLRFCPTYGDCYTVVTCDADDACAIPGIRFALRISKFDVTYGFMTCGGLKGLKEYGNDLYGAVPVGLVGVSLESLMWNWEDPYGVEGEDPYFVLEFYPAWGMEDGDTFQIYISEHFEGPFSLFETFDYYDSEYEVIPPVLGKRYYFKGRIIKSGGSVGYFSHYTVGMLPDYETAPDFTGLTAYGAEGGQHIHFWWNADDMFWGWSGKLPGSSETTNFDVDECGGGYEVQFTDVDPSVVTSIWDQNESSGDLTNPYDGHVQTVSLGWICSCYDVDAEDYGYKIWFRIRGVGIPYWYLPDEEDTVYGAWSDPAVGWVQGHEDDAGWEPDNPMRITNFTATTDLAEKITLAWDAVPTADWPSWATDTNSGYGVYYYDDSSEEWTFLTSVLRAATTVDITDFESGESIDFIVQAFSYNSGTGETVYGEVSAQVTGAEA